MTLGDLYNRDFIAGIKVRLRNGTIAELTTNNGSLWFFEGLLKAH